MPENQRKTIQIATVEMANGRYKIRSTGGETYSFFSKSRDGYPTAVFQSFQEHNIQPGSVADIVYVENAGVNQTTGSPITYRNIQEFKPCTGEPTVGPRPATAPAAPRPQGNGVKTIMVDEARLETEIIGKMVFGFIQSEIQAGNVTIKVANTAAYVDEAVMLAERVQNQCKGPYRERARHGREGRSYDVPPQPEPAEAFDNWEELQ